MPSFLLAFTTGVAALQSVAGASLRPNGEGTVRHLQDQTVYCNSIGCPDGFQPIPDAWTVECSGECSVDQCCEAFCSSVACPDGFTQVQDAGTIECSGDCSADQCCEAFCSYYACPDGFIQVPDAGTILCSGDCSADQCCVDGDTGGNDGVEPGQPGQEVLLCNSIGCPGGYTPIPDAWMTECTDDPCSVDQCCEAFCSYYACPDNYTPVADAAEIKCDSDCNTDLCCDAALVLCNSIGCPGGFTPVPEAWTIECSDDPCSVDQCCEAFCSYYACPDNYIPVEDAAEIKCDSDCNTDLCCMYNGP
eukprot:g9446.t1